MTAKIKQSILVIRDGSIDDQWLKELEAQQRRELLLKYGNDALRAAIRAPVVIGRAVVWLMTHEATESQALQ